MHVHSSHSSVPPLGDVSFEGKLLQGLAAYQQAVREGDLKARTAHEASLEKILARVGPSEREVYPVLLAVMRLENEQLTKAAVAAIANLDGVERSNAIPSIVEAALKGDNDLLVTGSRALGKIPGEASLIAMVELCEELSRVEPCKDAEKYKVLLKQILPAFVERGEACLPFISQVQDALSSIAPEGQREHIRVLNSLRVMLREERASDYAGVDFPGQIPLGRLVAAPKKPIGELIEIECKELPLRENPLVDERIRFKIQKTRSDAGLEIYSLTGGAEHLVLFVEDKDGFGTRVPSVVAHLASAVSAQYNLNPRCVYWATLTTRDSGYADSGEDCYTLFDLKYRESSGRFEAITGEHFPLLRDLLARIERKIA